MRNKVKYERDILVAAVARSTSMAEVLRILGLKQAGGSQVLVSRKIQELGISTSHFTGCTEYKSYQNRTCKKCQKLKSLEEFEVIIRSNGQYRKWTCKTCYAIARYAGPEGEQRRIRDNATKKEWIKICRQNPINRSQFLWQDSRKADRKRGLENTLSKEQVSNLISQACSYCGETSLKMTLDRKDNSLGHTEENCVPCCLRCNFIRRDMPYEAWVKLAPTIRKIREAGLFGAWTCTIHKANARKSN
jgi:hypothetical protein